MDIQSMTTLEKLQAMEQLWESLEESEVTPPAWHRDVVKQRRKALQENPESYTPLQQVRELRRL